MRILQIRECLDHGSLEVTIQLVRMFHERRESFGRRSIWHFRYSCNDFLLIGNFGIGEQGSELWQSLHTMQIAKSKGRSAGVVIQHGDECRSSVRIAEFSERLRRGILHGPGFIL